MRRHLSVTCLVIWISAGSSPWSPSARAKPAASSRPADPAPLTFEIQRQTILKEFDGKSHWFGLRATAVPADAKGGPENYMPQLEPWLAYVRAGVARYKGRIHTWEVWNEPNIGFWLSSNEDYVRLLKATYTAIKSVDPTARVTMGGPCWFVFLPDTRLSNALPLSCGRPSSADRQSACSTAF